MDYKYRIWSVNEEERWIFIISDDELDMEEPDSFVSLVKTIRDDVHGQIERVGNDQYKIIGDQYGLVYQWDEVFGITVVYPKTTELENVKNFLGKYMDKGLEEKKKRNDC